MYRPMRVHLFLAFLLWVSLQGWVLADTHWANPAGSKVPPYTSYTTGAHDIQDAIDTSDKGDTVFVASGTYDLDTTVVVRDSIVFTGAGMDSTLFRWTSYSLGAYMVFADAFASIQNLALDGTRKGVDGFGFEIAHKYVEVAYCKARLLSNILRANWQSVEVHDCEFSVETDGLVLRPYLPKLVHHNTFYGDGLAVTSSGPAELYNNVFHIENQYRYDVRIEQCSAPNVIHNNIFLGAGYDCAAVYAYGVSIENNTFIGATHKDGAIQSVFGGEPGGTITIKNNAFYDCAGTFMHIGSYVSPASWVFQYNLIWPPKDPLFQLYELADLDTIGNIFVDPMLTSDSNFYLQAGSPCINAGDPTILDVDGSRSDIGWTGGPGGQTYEYPEEAPTRPDTLIGGVAGSTLTLIWPQSTEADLAEYRIYRDNESGFLPHGTNRIGIVDNDTTFADDFSGESADLFYVTTAVDTAGMESEPSNEVVVLYTGIFEETEPTGNLPRTPYIIANYPNPFNAATTIEYVIPAIGARPARVQLCIYDALGRKVATVVDERQYPGRRRTIWDGRDDGGRSLASGVYFARLVLWGYEFNSSKKLVLQK